MSAELSVMSILLVLGFFKLLKVFYELIVLCIGNLQLVMTLLLRLLCCIWRKYFLFCSFEEFKLCTGLAVSELPYALKWSELIDLKGI